MKLRVAIVGAGPAGIYAADSLLKHERSFDVSIDLFERLPAPYGLVRYGVAPDHPRIKGIINALKDILDSGKIRLFGNVNYGTDITMEDLKRHYHAVIFATGAMSDAAMNIPGIDLPGSFGAADFVSWYDGHPDVRREWPLDAEQIAVIGNGNVALDVARMLVKHPEDLLATEIPDNVSEALRSSPVTDVHILGRRGPMQVKFTPLELREIGELRDVDIVLHGEDFDMDTASQEAIQSNKQLSVINRVFQSWRERKPTGASRRLHFHFYANPLEILGGSHVTGIRYSRTEPDGAGGVQVTRESRVVDVQAVYRAVGYFGSPLDCVPFDSRRGTIPNHEGQVLDDSNRLVPGVYVTGWIKRGPVGLIGHTKSDAMETVRHLFKDQGSWWAPTEPDEGSVESLLSERRVEYTNLAGWKRLDFAERRLGHERGRERLKVVPRKEMIQLSSTP